MKSCGYDFIPPSLHLHTEEEAIGLIVPFPILRRDYELHFVILWENNKLMTHAKFAKSAKVGVGVLTTEYTEYTEFCGGAATTKTPASRATRKSCAVEQIRNGATVRENDARFGENYARLRENYARVRERKKPTVGELLTTPNECFYFSPEITAFMSSTDSSSIA